jgi:hypothetical protein
MNRRKMTFLPALGIFQIVSSLFSAFPKRDRQDIPACSIIFDTLEKKGLPRSLFFAYRFEHGFGTIPKI